MRVACVQGYWNDPEQTAEVLVDGWLLTGDLGRLDSSGHLLLSGRLKNMIVTEGGKNIYPEDIEAAFAGWAVKEFCVFAVNYIWKQRSLAGEQLMIVLRLDPGAEVTKGLVNDLTSRNHSLADFKRLSGYASGKTFPTHSSMKIKRKSWPNSLCAPHPRERLKALWRPLRHETSFAIINPVRRWVAASSRRSLQRLRSHGWPSELTARPPVMPHSSREVTRRGPALPGRCGDGPSYESSMACSSALRKSGVIGLSASGPFNSVLRDFATRERSTPSGYRCLSCPPVRRDSTETVGRSSALHHLMSLGFTPRPRVYNAIQAWRSCYRRNGAHLDASHFPSFLRLTDRRTGSTSLHLLRFQTRFTGRQL